MFSELIEIFHKVRCLELRYSAVGDLLLWPSALSKNCKYQHIQVLDKCVDSLFYITQISVYFLFY